MARGVVEGGRRCHQRLPAASTPTARPVVPLSVSARQGAATKGVDDRAPHDPADAPRPRVTASDPHGSGVTPRHALSGVWWREDWAPRRGRGDRGPSRRGGVGGPEEAAVVRQPHERETTHEGQRADARARRRHRRRHRGCRGHAPPGSGGDAGSPQHPPRASAHQNATRRGRIGRQRGPPRQPRPERLAG